MDALTKKAVADAREGRWQLLDAMELDSRSRADCTVVCLVHQVGDFALIGHCEGGPVDGESEAGGDVECTFCDGEGDLDVEGRDGRTRNVVCPVCDGEGLVDRSDAKHTHSINRGDVTHWRRLTGELVELGESTFLMRTMTIKQAREIVEKALAELARREEIAHAVL